MKALNRDFFFESLISLSYLLAASVQIHSEFFSKQSAKISILWGHVMVAAHWKKCGGIAP